MSLFGSDYGFDSSIYNRKSSPNPFDQKFKTPSYGFDVKGSLGGGKYDDYGAYTDVFSPKKKETDNFLKNFINKGFKKPDEDSTAAKIAQGIYKSYRPDRKSSEDKINDMIAARIGLGNQGGGFAGTQDVAQGLTLSGQGGGLREPMIIAGQEGSGGGLGGAIGGAAGGYLQGGPVGAVIGGIGGLFCDVRVKEDIAPLQKSEVNDLLSECAFFVKDLNECS
tara:strand:- start:9 stop:674 length:666 start_codon:yes stop_codon:yes gene_type:complete